MRSIRRAIQVDLKPLIALYLHSNPDTPTLQADKAESIWSDLLARQGVTVFVGLADAQIVATCVLITVPNLMRGGRPFAFIENVVTHGAFRRQGHGRAVIDAALDAAWNEDCYSVLLLTGRKDPAVHQFYEKCGFRAGIKTGYVALNPRR